MVCVYALVRSEACLGIPVRSCTGYSGTEETMASEGLNPSPARVWCRQVVCPSSIPHSPLVLFGRTDGFFPSDSLSAA